MKKLASIVMAMTISVTSLAGCASSSSSSSVSASSALSSSSTEGSESAVSNSAEPFKVGLVQLVEHTSLDQIREAFIAEIDSLGYTDKIEMDYQNGSGDQATINSICQKFAGENKDLIVAIATPAAQAAATAAPKIPLLFSAVTDPVAAKLVTNPSAPEALITGTSDDIPVKEIFGLMKQLTPDVKTVGLIYNLGEVNSVSVIEKAKIYCDENGLKYVEATVTNSSEVTQAAQSLVGKCDAVFSPIDNTVASAMGALADIGRKAKLPIYTGADSMVIDGGFATMSINYVQLGKQTADMAVKILEGAPVSSIPVETLTDFSMIINKTTADALGVAIPEEILKKATFVE